MIRKTHSDIGNWDVKTVDGSGNEKFFLHALAPLTDARWERVVAHGDPPEGFIKVNGVPFAYGATARRHQIRQLVGAQRYTRDYYGVLGAITMALHYREGGDVIYYGSYAPRDHVYTDRLYESIIGAWNVHSHNGKMDFRVTDAFFIDEPLAAMNHYNLSDSLNMRSRGSLLKSSVLVIDVGGLTVDLFAVDPDMQVDMSSMTSTNTGVKHIIDDFIESMRRRYADEFRDATHIDIRRIERALQTGAFPYGAGELDVNEERERALNTLRNAVFTEVRRFGGAVNFDAFLLAGGGAMLVESAMRERYDAVNICLAESNPDNMRMGTAFGLKKYFGLLEKIYGSDF